MRNPLESEEAAFRFVLGTIVYFAPIVVASLDRDVARRGRLRRADGASPSWLAPRRADAPAPRRSTSSARPSRTRGGSSWSPTRRSAARELREAILRMADGVAEDVLVVCPALNSQLRHVDVRRGRRPRRRAGAARGDARSAPGGRASARAARSATATRCRRSRTRCGASRPTRSSSRPTPPGSSHWLERGVVEAARARFDVPVTHVVGDDASTAQSSRCPARRPGSSAAPASRRLLAGDARDVARRRPAIWRRVELALERRHRRLAVRDALHHERGVGLRVVEVRADVPGRAGVGERVAAAAARRRRRPPSRRPRRRRRRRRRPSDGAGVVVAGWRRCVRFGSPMPATLPT